MQTQTDQKVSKLLITTLAAVFALSPFAIDSYLPALPTIALDLNVNIAMLSATVSLYVLGLAIGQLIGGPMSDKYGRINIMLLGLSIFALSSLLLPTSQHIYILWGWRLIQAVGGGIAIVGVPAIIRDMADGKEAAKLFALVALVMMIAPSIAPSIGHFILANANWHWVFYFMAGVAILIMPVAYKQIPKPKKLNNNEISKQDKLTVKDILTHKKALGYMFAQGLVFSVIVTYISNSAMIYMDIFKVSSQSFSLLISLNVVGLVLFNRLNAIMLNYFEPELLLRSFLTLQVISASCLVALSFFAPSYMPFIVFFILLTIGANGGIVANSNASFMKFFPHGAGKASALLGAFQYAAAGIISGFAAFISLGRLLPVTLTMLFASSLGLICVLYSNASRSQSQEKTQLDFIDVQNSFSVQESEVSKPL